MTTIKTNKCLPKLEKILQFRLGRDYSIPSIEIKQGIPAASSGSSKIFLPEEESIFSDPKNNELLLADNLIHESDRIVEYEEYFRKTNPEVLESQDEIATAFYQKHYSHLTENPALVSWLDNLVKDRRVDEKRRAEWQGAKQFYKKNLLPAASYQRPNVGKLSELDALRELLLQKALLGRNVGTIPQSRRRLFDELVELINSSDNIRKDPEVVQELYQRLKDNFDVTEKIKRLPPLPGKNDSSKSKGSPQQGYQGQVQLREGRKQGEKKPKCMQEGKLKEYNKDKSSEDDNTGEGKREIDLRKDAEIRNAKTGAERYKKLGEKYNVEINLVSEQNAKIGSLEQKLRNDYYNEIIRMKSIFKRLSSKNSAIQYEYEGNELDFENFMQADLEGKAIGIRHIRKYFVNDKPNTDKTAWAVLSDISPSTDPKYYNIIDQIKANMLIQGEALGLTHFPFGLYAFSGELYVIKDFEEPYSSKVAKKIVGVRRESDMGTNIGDSLMVVKDMLLQQKANKRGVAVITDGKSNRGINPEEVIYECYQQKVFPFVIIIGSEFEKYGKSITSKVGSEHYSVIERDELHKLPNEMLRLFRTYGISK